MPPIHGQFRDAAEVVPSADLALTQSAASAQGATPSAHATRAAYMATLQDHDAAGRPVAHPARIKMISYGEKAAGDEFLAGQISSRLGLGPRVDYIIPRPTAEMASPSPQLASYLLPSFLDLGAFLALPEIASLCTLDQQPVVQTKQRELLALREEIKLGHARHPEVDQKARVGFPLPGGLELPDNAVRTAYAAAGDAAQRQMRQRYHQEQTLLGELFSLLPTEMQDEMRAALICQGVANAHWDGLNHRWSNTGFYRDGVGAWRVATVDGGNTHSSGFGGRAKVDSVEAVLGLPALMSSFAANPIHEQDLKPRAHFPGGLGLNLPLGGVPRSDVYASLFRGTLAGREAQDGLRCSAPHCEAAYRLRAFLLRVPKDLGVVLDAQAREHGTGLAEDFFATRWDAACRRMGAYINELGSAAIARWAASHQEGALRIDAELVRSMESASAATILRALPSLTASVRPGRERSR